MIKWWYKFRWAMAGKLLTYGLRAIPDTGTRLHIACGIEFARNRRLRFLEQQLLAHSAGVLPKE